MEADVVYPAKQKWAGPIIPVCEQDGTFQFCKYYRRLHVATLSDAYPMPRMDDFTDSVGEAQDCAAFAPLQRYWQVSIMLKYY